MQMASKKDTEAIEELAKEPLAFFPHDSNASADIKCRRLIRRLGVEGYGRWWLLCELLASANGHAIPIETEEDILIVADALKFDGGSFSEPLVLEDCKKFIDCVLDLGLIRLSDDGKIVSDRMLDNSKYFGQQRHNGRKGGRPRKNKQADESSC